MIYYYIYNIIYKRKKQGKTDLLRMLPLVFWPRHEPASRPAEIRSSSWVLQLGLVLVPPWDEWARPRSNRRIREAPPPLTDPPEDARPAKDVDDPCDTVAVLLLQMDFPPEVSFDIAQLIIVPDSPEADDTPWLAVVFGVKQQLPLVPSEKAAFNGANITDEDAVVASGKLLHALPALEQMQTQLVTSPPTLTLAVWSSNPPSAKRASLGSLRSNSLHSGPHGEHALSLSIAWLDVHCTRFMKCPSDAFL